MAEDSSLRPCTLCHNRAAQEQHSQTDQPTDVAAEMKSVLCAGGARWGVAGACGGPGRASEEEASEQLLSAGGVPAGQAGVERRCCCRGAPELVLTQKA